MSSDGLRYLAEQEFERIMTKLASAANLYTNGKLTKKADMNLDPGVSGGLMSKLFRGTANPLILALLAASLYAAARSNKPVFETFLQNLNLSGATDTGDFLGKALKELGPAALLGTLAALSGEVLRGDSISLDELLGGAALGSTAYAGVKGFGPQVAKWLGFKSETPAGAAAPNEGNAGGS
ncbi:MAG: hypothetical protein QXK26_02095 [Candidatus Bathyarchaeia archaeon]